MKKITQTAMLFFLATLFGQSYANKFIDMTFNFAEGCAMGGTIVFGTFLASNSIKSIYDLYTYDKHITNDHDEDTDDEQCIECIKYNQNNETNNSKTNKLLTLTTVSFVLLMILDVVCEKMRVESLRESKRA